MKKIILFLLLAFACSKSSSAQWLKPGASKESAFTSGRILFDEDFLLELFDPKHNLDRSYTGGGGLMFSGAFVEKWRLNILNRLADKVTGFDKIHNSRIYRINTLTIGVSTFSPYGRDLNKTTPITDDRPYASFTFLNTSRTSADFFEENAWTTEFTFAMLGLKYGGDLQAGIHKIYREKNGLCDTCRPYNPVGWPLQVSNGGEPTFEYGVQYKHLLLGKEKNGDNGKYKNYDLFYTLYGTVGYVTSLQAMLTGRVGLIRSKWYAFNSNSMGSMTEALDNSPKGWRNIFRNTEAYLFCTLHPKLIGYNATLEGQFRNRGNQHVFNNTEINHAQFQIEAGLGLSFLKFISLNASYVWRTPEFNTPKGIPFSYVALSISGRAPFYKKAAVQGKATEPSNDEENDTDSPAGDENEKKKTE